MKTFVRVPPKWQKQKGYQQKNGGNLQGTLKWLGFERSVPVVGCEDTTAD
jgi:hypothetical protein